MLIWRKVGRAQKRKNKEEGKEAIKKKIAAEASLGNGRKL